LQLGCICSYRCLFYLHHFLSNSFYRCSSPSVLNVNLWAQQIFCEHTT
jgi:hypothetical protein